MLYAGNTNKNGFKALIAAEYSGVNIELVKNFEMGVSNKTPEFLKMNPIGKVSYDGMNKVCYFDTNCLCQGNLKELSFCDFQVPVLETPDGAIFESNAIARYGKTWF